ncbi:MAG: type II toxin-antitoxin system Phd/YefM family antitoxin [Chloroflexi bacterium]|nr:type II toxin-antitoxin system Phd/YefM family antitoxin [Chloroflexota bacterium]
MSEQRVPIGEFRARIAELLRLVRETKATYVLTSRGEPVAEVVPYGSAIRRGSKPLLGMYEGAGVVFPWEDEGITEEEYGQRERTARIAEQEARLRRRAAE